MNGFLRLCQPTVHVESASPRFVGLGEVLQLLPLLIALHGRARFVGVEDMLPRADGDGGSGGPGADGVAGAAADDVDDSVPSQTQADAALRAARDAPFALPVENRVVVQGFEPEAGTVIRVADEQHTLASHGAAADLTAIEYPAADGERSRLVRRMVGDVRPLVGAGEIQQVAGPRDVLEAAVIAVARAVVQDIAGAVVGRPVADRCQREDRLLPIGGFQLHRLGRR